MMGLDRPEHVLGRIIVGAMDSLNLANAAFATSNMNREMQRQRKEQEREQRGRQRAAEVSYGPRVEVAHRRDDGAWAPLYLHACSCGALVLDTEAHDRFHQTLA